VLESEQIEKVGHDLKFAMSVLRSNGVRLGGKFFDTMIAHSLIEPDMRHALDYLSEMYLGYTPSQMGRLLEQAQAPHLNLTDLPPEKLADYAVEHADLAGAITGAIVVKREHADETLSRVHSLTSSSVGGTGTGESISVPE